MPNKVSIAANAAHPTQIQAPAQPASSDATHRKAQHQRLDPCQCAATRGGRWRWRRSCRRRSANSKDRPRRPIVPTRAWQRESATTSARDGTSATRQPPPAIVKSRRLRPTKRSPVAHGLDKMAGRMGGGPSCTRRPLRINAEIVSSTDRPPARRRTEQANQCAGRAPGLQLPRLKWRAHSWRVPQQASRGTIWVRTICAALARNGVDGADDKSDRDQPGRSTTHRTTRERHAGAATAITDSPTTYTGSLAHAIEPHAGRQRKQHKRYDFHRRQHAHLVGEARSKRPRSAAMRASSLETAEGADQD